MSTADLTPPYAVEIVNYRLNEDADTDAFLAINRQVGADFTSVQAGFLHHAIGCAEGGTWPIAFYWRTADDARDPISGIDTIPDAVKAYMGMIERETPTRSIFDVV